MNKTENFKNLIKNITLDVVETSHIFGLVAKDVDSGFTGKITAITFDSSYGTQICLTPQVSKDGSYNDKLWFHVSQIEIPETTKGKKKK